MISIYIAIHPCKYSGSSIAIYINVNIQCSEYYQCHVVESVFHTVMITI